VCRKRTTNAAVTVTVTVTVCVCVSVYIETYGCQMNVNDAEIAWSILRSHGFTQATNIRDVSHCTCYFSLLVVTYLFSYPSLGNMMVI